MPALASLGSKDFRAPLALLAACLLLLSAVAALPIEFVFPSDVYLPAHTAMEVFSIVVAWLVFAVGWDTHDRSRARTTALLGCAFLGVAMIDFGHTLSFVGMPDFITPASPEKSINFSLATRLLAGIALLGLALLPWRPLRVRGERYLYLAATLLLVGVVYWIGLYRLEWLPRMFVAGQGLTPVKVWTEVVLLALYVGAAVAFYFRWYRECTASWVYLFAASGVMGLSQIYNALYIHPSDLDNFLSHVYRVVGYTLIYRSVFISGVREPYDLANRLREELEASTAKLRDMGARLQADIEAERKRIARSLHDELGQDLTALRMDFGWIQKHYADHDTISEVAARMQQTVEGSAIAIRRIVGDLRPLILDDLGISAAAKTLAADFGARTGLDIKFDSVDDFAELPESHQTALFRILQESLTNVARHAGAGEVRIRLRSQRGGVLLSVRDNGCGFAEEARGKQGSFGLFGMTERAHQLGGFLSVVSAPGSGTEVTAWLPVDATAPKTDEQPDQPDSTKLGEQSWRVSELRS